MTSQWFPHHLALSLKTLAGTNSYTLNNVGENAGHALCDSC